MSSDDKQLEFADQAKRLFDESVEQLDGATLSKLNQSRHLALEKIDTRRPALLRWAPAGGLAAAAVVAVVVMQSPTQLEAPPTTNAADFEILLSEDNLDMFENLEFYSWLDQASEDDLG